MRLRNQKSRSLATMVFIGILLFNYVNSTMFWHSHIVDGRIIWHSHIYWKSHVTGNSDGGHTAGQLKLLDIVSHIPCTDTVIPDLEVDRIEVLEYVVIYHPSTVLAACHPYLFSLRGPPVC